MQLLTPSNFPDYELIDCGNFEKLERFGKYILIRPEPQAVWDKKLSEREWEKTAHVKFIARTSSSGDWKKFREMPDRWSVQYDIGDSERGDIEKRGMGDREQLAVGSKQSQTDNDASEIVGRGAEDVGRETGSSRQLAVGSKQSQTGNDASSLAGRATSDEGHNKNLTSHISHLTSLRFRLALTAFKHVGIFPEQAVNWDYIYESVKNISSGIDFSSASENALTVQPKVLNLFAYTGGASLAAKAAGADITHLDSIKQVVTWSKENMELSGLKDIRWVVEDALTFVKREVKRGKKYNGIILDPPAYGHGANGEKWKLEDHLNEMMKHVLTLLDEKNSFLVLNTYSLGFSSLIIENLLSGIPKLETGELFLHAKTGYKLPLGVFGRFRRA